VQLVIGCIDSSLHMNVISQLASSLNRRDEVPNQELANKILKKRDSEAVKELVGLLTGKDKNIQGDCIKVLYEIGVKQPALIKDYMADFIALLRGKNNRLAWGSMMALNHITHERPAEIYKQLPVLIDAADNGSVITRDNLVAILIKLESLAKYKGKAFPLLLEQMATCPTNQLAMYAEYAIPVIDKKNRLAFISLLQDRLTGIGRESMVARIQKVIRKISVV
jgi:hypothetical protein